jgi:hypothetical protein
MSEPARHDEPVQPNIVEAQRADRRSDPAPNENRGIKMGSRAVAVAAFLFAPLLAGAGAADARVEYSPTQYLKNFALSVCIADGYRSTEVVHDGLAAAGGYLELGSLPFEAYEEAESLGKQFLAKEYKSPSGEQLTLMKCIDFFHSKELDELARKYYKK